MRSIHNNNKIGGGGIYGSTGNGILTQLATAPRPAGGPSVGSNINNNNLNNSQILSNSQYTSQPSLVDQQQQQAGVVPTAVPAILTSSINNNILQQTTSHQPQSFSTSTPELNNLPFSLSNSQQVCLSMHNCSVRYWFKLKQSLKSLLVLHFESWKMKPGGV